VVVALSVPVKKAIFFLAKQIFLENLCYFYGHGFSFLAEDLD
jgi:hypothetical protein